MAAICYVNGKSFRLTENMMSLPIRGGLREDTYLSFDDGLTKQSIHRDVATLEEAINLGYISYSYDEYHKDHLFWEIIQSKDRVSHQVLDFLVDYAKEHKIKLKLDGAMSLLNHPSVLEWLLEKGVVCKHVQGHGYSTMENFLRKMKNNDANIKEYISLLKKYNAIDKEFIYNEASKYYPNYVVRAFIEEGGEIDEENTGLLSWARRLFKRR